MYPQTFPHQPFAPPDNMASAYPGMLPPPVQYEKKRRWPVILGALLALAVIAGLVVALVSTDRGDDSAPAAAVLTDASAKAAIQEYLDALLNGDDETIARHTLCGLFDAVKERRSDLALAGLSSDAFRKQYSQAQVTSIDKMVRSSPHQAQVLFTMSTTPATSGRRGGEPRPQEQQAVAQLLAYDNDVLVCSYLPRTGQY